MKIGLISDVHADLNSLNRALALLEREAVDMTICAGDLVERGLEGDAVVEIIRTCGIPCVRGNHDVDAQFNQEWMQETWTSPTPKQGHDCSPMKRWLFCGLCRKNCVSDGRVCES